MFKYSYNSNHKIITASIFILWAIFHFASRESASNLYENGQIKRTGGTVNARNHGVWTWYYENGQKEMQGIFVEGNREGKWETWDKNGNKISESIYKKDKLNGVYTRWNREGKVVGRQFYEDDVLVENLPKHPQ